MMYTMKYHIIIVFFSLFFCSKIIAQNRPLLIPYDGNNIAVVGDLKDGQLMSDLSWAWQSSVACFPKTQELKFNGNHQLFQFELPAKSMVEIILIPDDKNSDMSLYAYMVGPKAYAVVPNLTSCIRCESDYKWDRQWAEKTQDHTRIVKDILTIHRPYKVIVGVAGSNGLAEGTFKLQIIKK